MVQVRHTPTDTQGNPRTLSTVPIRLAGGGWVATTQSRIDKQSMPRTDATGLLVLDLEQQSAIDPAGTHYEFTEGDGVTVLSFVVPDGTPPHIAGDGTPYWWLRELLVENPTSPAPVIAGVTAEQLNAAVAASVNALVAGAPGALDTLNEIAAALGDDPNFATSMTAALAARLRVDAAQTLSSGQQLQGRGNLGLGDVAVHAASDFATPGQVNSAIAALGLGSASTHPASDFATPTSVTAAVNTAVNALVAGAPGALDTLKELAAAIGDNANFAGTVTAALANRLRTDVANTLTSGQQQQLRTDLGLGTAAVHAVGDFDAAGAAAAAQSAAAIDATTKANAAQSAAATDTTSKVNALQSSLPAVFAPLSGAPMVPLGASIEVYQDDALAWGVTWPHQVCNLSLGRLYMPHNAGIPGNTTAQMLARFDTDVAPYAPATVIVGCISNDVLQNVDPATTRANLVAIIAKIRAIGAKPVLTTSEPLTATGITAAQIARIQTHNQWAQRYAARHKIRIADIYAALVDPTSNGAWRATPVKLAQDDGTHPTPAGWAVIAETVFATLFPNGVTGYLGLATCAGDTTNLATNGLMQTAGSGGMAAGWLELDPATSGTMTPSLVDDPMRPGGRAQLLTLNEAVGNCGMIKGVDSGYSPGDVLQFSVAVDVNAPDVPVSMVLQTFGGTAIVVSEQISVQGRALLRREITIPADTGGAALSVLAGPVEPASGTVGVGGVTIRNLTTGDMVNV